MTKEQLDLARVALWIHTHRATAWALMLKDHVHGEMKFRLNGGLSHLNKLCSDFEKHMGDEEDYVFERGEVIDRLLSIDDPMKYNEIIDLIQLHLDDKLTIVNDEKENDMA